MAVPYKVTYRRNILKSLQLAIIIFAITMQYFDSIIKKNLRDKTIFNCGRCLQWHEA